jgi:hypothetical protein
MRPIKHQITACSNFEENIHFKKLSKIKFVDISFNIEYFYRLQIDNLHHQTSISVLYDKYKLNITCFYEFWQFS